MTSTKYASRVTQTKHSLTSTSKSKTAKSPGIGNASGILLAMRAKGSPSKSHSTKASTLASMIEYKFNYGYQDRKTVLHPLTYSSQQMRESYILLVSGKLEYADVMMGGRKMLGARFAFRGLAVGKCLLITRTTYASSLTFNIRSRLAERDGRNGS